MANVVNYSTSVARALPTLCAAGNKVALRLLQILPKALAFSLPADGRLLEAGWRTLANHLRLPFGICSLSFPITHHMYSKMFVCIYRAVPTPDGTSKLCGITAVANRSNEWEVLPLSLLLNEFGLDPNVLEAVRTLKLKANQAGITPLFETQLRVLALHAIFDFSEALTCSNVSTEIAEPVDPRVNARRMRDGKAPLLETRVLVINAGKTPPRGNESQGTHHAGPRQHLRRGHIRRLPKENIFVQPCVVGDPKRGTVKQQYVVRA